MRSDAERWNGRYAGRGPGDPSAPTGLAAGFVRLGGRCVDVACGLGEQSIWAAEHGFAVIALDVSDRAIGELRAEAVRRGLESRIDARVVDLDAGLPDDLAGTAALAICQRFRDPSLYEALADLLAPDGVLVVTVLSAVGAEGAPGRFHAPAGELRDTFVDGELEILHHVEADGEATLVARRTSPKPAERVRFVRT